MGLVMLIQQSFQDLEREQTAFLSAGRQRDFEQVEHVLGLKLPQLFQRFAFNGLAQNRGRRLADRTPFSVEITFRDLVSLQTKLNCHLVAANRVSIGMHAAGIGETAFMIRRLVMV